MPADVLAPGIFLRMCPVNESWHYTATASLIGWAHTWNGPCSTLCTISMHSTNIQDMGSSRFLRLSISCQWTNAIIQNGWQDVGKSQKSQDTRVFIIFTTHAAGMEYSSNLGKSFVSVVQGKSGKVGNQFTYGIKGYCMGPLDLIGLWIPLSHWCRAGDANASSPRISWPDDHHTKAWWNSKYHEHICSFNSLRPMRCLCGTKPLSEPMLYCQFPPKEKKIIKIVLKIETFSFKKIAFEYVVWIMSVILSRPQCVKETGPITMEFCTYQASMAVLKKKRILMFYHISLYILCFHGYGC